MSERTETTSIAFPRLIRPAAGWPIGQARIAGRRSGGFTLIEAALVTIIIGVGAVSMLELLATGTVANRDATAGITATNLARNIHELSLRLTFKDPTSPTSFNLESGESKWNCDDLDDLNGQEFQPPIDAAGIRQDSLAEWKQRVTVQTVDPIRPWRDMPNGSYPALRITVTISRNNRLVQTMTWYAYDTQ